MEKEILLHIGGMSCVNCQNKIEKKLRSAKGIIRANVSYSKGTAEILYDTVLVAPLEDVTQKLSLFSIIPK